MYTHNHNKGFTLVETLVAITILLLAIIGPMSIAAKGLQMAHFSNQQTTAVFLAQEAIESIERLRDDQALQQFDDFLGGGPGSGDGSWDWFDDGSSPVDDCKSPNTCDYDAVAGDYHQCLGGSCDLLINEARTDYVYQYDNGDPSIYTRTISLNEDSPGVVQITVTITWATRLFSSPTRSVVLETWLYDVYGGFN